MTTRQIATAQTLSKRLSDVVADSKGWAELVAYSQHRIEERAATATSGINLPAIRSCDSAVAPANAVVRGAHDTFALTG